MMTAHLLFIGTTELMLIAGIALLLFGGKKLPELARSLGKAKGEFKKGCEEGEKLLKEEDEKKKDAEKKDEDFAEK